ncbi:MAG: hypothetical protein U5R46_13965 [Gammaproteobacteria bacterium]|nr:hypothetical protein [Gammaproteobacteria bacterium]
MTIVDTSGRPLLDIEDWAKLYDTPRISHQWKKGRSAYSVAEFIFNRDGLEHIGRRASEVLGTPLNIEKAVPEYEVRFDEYGRGRVHDLGIYAKTQNSETVFVGVEAKVDESFGGTILDSYLDAKAKQICGVSTNAPQRIEKLLGQHFLVPSRDMFDVRYQLLYATIGTIAAKADHSILYVLVFRTDLYSETKSAENYRDYVYFMEKVGAIPFKIADGQVQGHEIKFDGTPLKCIYEYIDT